MSRPGDRDLNLGSGNEDEKTSWRGICKGLVTQGTGEWIRRGERIRKKEREVGGGGALSYLNLGERGTNNEIQKGKDGHQ